MVFWEKENDRGVGAPLATVITLKIIVLFCHPVSMYMSINHTFRHQIVPLKKIAHQMPSPWLISWWRKSWPKWAW